MQRTKRRGRSRQDVWRPPSGKDRIPSSGKHPRERRGPFQSLIRPPGIRDRGPMDGTFGRGLREPIRLVVANRLNFSSKVNSKRSK
ncbi:hypothetical protein TNCT_508691 [Trichonephila clavata]|uniref:Uncharacterized protein n=1 Tax=Trichonephila clavata TaxID=2740835 RepID=A0A8X6GTA5_TRICU|nr:hypothetical protein TNCT_508691 [Trichonephila clavata]